jgi:serine/threonine protein kinase
MGMLISVEQLIRGPDLHRAIEVGEAVEEVFVLQIGMQVCTTMQAAWDAGKIIHRDLKPHNVIVMSNSPSITEGLTPIVIDWGLAVSVKDGKRDTRRVFEHELDQMTAEVISDTLTMAGVVMGTLYYMPPEQLMGDKLDHRADQYSLGALLFHILTGEPPLKPETVPKLDELVELEKIPDEDLTKEKRARKTLLLKQWQNEKAAREQPSLIFAIRMRTPEPANRVAERNGRKVSRQLAEVLDRCLSKEPKDRYKSWKALRKALLKCQRSLFEPEQQENEEGTGSEDSASWWGKRLWDRLRGK